MLLSGSGPCVSRPHKACKHKHQMSEPGEGQQCGSGDAEPSQQQGLGHNQRGTHPRSRRPQPAARLSRRSRRSARAPSRPLGLRHRPPPEPGRVPPQPSLLRPAGLPQRATHRVAAAAGGGRAGCRGDAQCGREGASRQAAPRRRAGELAGSGEEAQPG